MHLKEKAVPQISMRLNRLRQDHRRMLSYYLAFWRKNREVLLEGKLTALNRKPDTARFVLL